MTFLHPADADLLAFAEGSAPDPLRRRVATHLADCERCRRAVQGYRAVRAALTALPIDAPEPLLQRIRASRAAGARAILPTAELPAPPRRLADRLRLVGRDAAAIVDGPPYPDQRAAWYGRPLVVAAAAMAAVMFLALWPHPTPPDLRDTSADGFLPGLAFTRRANAEHPAARFRAATIDPSRLSPRTLRYAMTRGRATIGFEVATVPDPARPGTWRVIQRGTDGGADTIPLALDAPRYRAFGDFIVLLSMVPLSATWRGSVVQRPGGRDAPVAWDLAVTGTFPMPTTAGPVAAWDMTVRVADRPVVRLLVRRDDGTLLWVGGPSTPLADGLALVSETPSPR